MILFEYKGVQVKFGDTKLLSKDKIILLFTAELKKQIDRRIYNERAKEILFDYTLAADEGEIIKVLAEEEERLSNP